MIKLNFQSNKLQDFKPVLIQDYKNSTKKMEREKTQQNIANALKVIELEKIKQREIKVYEDSILFDKNITRYNEQEIIALKENEKIETIPLWVEKYVSNENVFIEEIEVQPAIIKENKMVNNCQTNINETMDAKKSFTKPVFSRTLGIKKPIGLKKPIIPIEHEPFGLMRIVVISLILYIVFNG